MENKYINYTNNKITINAAMQPGEESKLKKYQGIVNELISIAKELNVDTIELSGEFVPILYFSNLEKTDLSNINIIGKYSFGIKDNINFIISPEYINSGKLGELDIQLVNEK